MRFSEKDINRIQDMIDNIISINDYVGDYAFDDFDKDQKTIDAVERCLERITEAAIQIGDEKFAELLPDHPLEKMRGLGNRLRHEYSKISNEIIWDTVVEALPTLLYDCEQAINRLKNQSKV